MGGGGSSGSFTPAPSTTAPTNVGAPLDSGLGDLFDLTGGVGTLSGSYVAPKTVSGAVRLGVKGGTDPRAHPPHSRASPGGGGGAPGGLFWVTPQGFLVSLAQVWLPAMKAKGLEISGTFSRQVGSISMDLVLTNKALQVMSDFAIQFNRNR